MSVAVAAAAATPSPSVIEQTAMATMVARRSTATTAETDESSVLNLQEEGSDRVLQLLENAAVAASYGDSVMNLCQKSENLFIKNGGCDSDVITSNNRRVLAGNNGDFLYNSGVTVKSSLELMEEDDDLPLVISQRQQEQLQLQLQQQKQLEKVLVTDGVDPDPRFEPPSGDHQLMHMPDTIFILCSDEKDDSDAFQNAMR